MNREKKIKVFLGSAYILIVFVFLLFFFNKFSFQDFSSYELIRENRNALEEIKNGNILISSIIFFLSNILFFYESTYFNDLANQSPLLHTWSLSVEASKRNSKLATRNTPLSSKRSPIRS